MLYSRRLFIVSYAHCVLVSFIVNDYVERTEVTRIVKVQGSEGQQQTPTLHPNTAVTVSYSLLQFKEVDYAHHMASRF